MAIQLIFCVETNKRADTDSIYISETINHLYLVNSKTKISKVYLNTKTRYKAKDVMKEIAGKTKAFTIGETKVIYCIDTDEYEKDAEHKRELDEIRRFCKEGGYDLIWFCHDVCLSGQKDSGFRKGAGSVGISEKAENRGDGFQKAGLYCGKGTYKQYPEHSGRVSAKEAVGLAA